LLVLGHDGNRLARLEVLEDQEEEIVDRLWNCELVPIRPDEFSFATLNHAAEIADLPLLRLRN